MFGHAGPLGVKSQWVVGPVVRTRVGVGGLSLGIDLSGKYSRRLCPSLHSITS